MASTEDNTTPENLVQLSPESKPTNSANDLNKRINSLETTLSDLKKQLKASQNSVKQALTAGDASQEVKNQITDTLKQLAILENNYQALVKNTTDLSSESKKLATRLTTNSGKQTKAISSIENKLLSELDTRLNNTTDDLNNRLQDTRQSLQAIKERIDQDIQHAINASESRDQELTLRADNVSEATIKLANTLDTMSQELTANIDELGTISEQRDDSLNEKIDGLTTHMTEGHEQLKSRINASNKSIEAVDQSAKNRDQAISNDLNSITQSVEQQSGQIKQLDQHNKSTEKKVETAHLSIVGQSSRIEALNLVDKKMSLRAQQLEVSTDKLSQQTISLENTADNLGTQTESLLSSVSKLSQQTDTLGETAQQHQLALSTLSFKENHHYNVMKGSLVLLALLAAGGFLYERGLWQSNELETQTLQHNMDSQKMALENAHLKLSSVQQNLTTQSAKTDSLQKQIDALKSKVTGVNDGVESLDGRLIAMMPNRTFGGDNTVHGAAWIQQQDPRKFTILLTSVTTKQEMYDIANRYGYRLKQKIAYYTVEQQGITHYVIVYGNFETQQQALNTVRRLPVPNFQRRPYVLQMQQVQSAIE